MTPLRQYAHGLTAAQWRDAAGFGLACLLASLVLSLVHGVFLDRTRVPDLEPFMQFEFPTVGPILDRHGAALMEFGERRSITPYADIPPVVQAAVLAAEDKRFFLHRGFDYLSLVRVASKGRLGRDRMFPQGGSTITQQLVRGVFLTERTAGERGADVQSHGVLARVVSWVLGAPSVNRLVRKGEEIRLAIWLEQEMVERFGSRRRAKEELLARYVSFVYMGRGQHGFARASEYYFGRPVTTLAMTDADLAATLAGIMKAPRDYAPTLGNADAVRRRRDQILALMAASGALSDDALTAAQARPLPEAASGGPRPAPHYASAVVQHVLDDFTRRYEGRSMEDLTLGRVEVHTTVDARVQRAAADALEHGLKLYEARHPAAAGLVQGAVVVLQNRDGAVLAETGGRQVYLGRETAYSDFNRVREARRQPGSAMKPLVYLAAFREGAFTLDTWVSDEPISVPDGGPGLWKSIGNYDGQFKGWMPLRMAFAESRNTVAIWLAQQVGMERVRRAARSVGVETELKPYASTALGASEMHLLELATAYRTLASGILAPPYIVRRVVTKAGDEIPSSAPVRPAAVVADHAMALIQEGLRGVVRMPTGTAHSLASRRFPIAVMGKTGTTNGFRDAIFVGSTYGPDGITVAVRIGFDDNRTLGSRETGGRVALPVFEVLMRELYARDLVGPAPVFPPQMEQRISEYLSAPTLVAVR